MAVKEETKKKRDELREKLLDIVLENTNNIEEVFLDLKKKNPMAAAMLYNNLANLALPKMTYEKTEDFKKTETTENTEDLDYINQLAKSVKK